MPQLTEQVETQIKGIKDKNAELLDKLTKAKHDDLMASSARLMAAADKMDRVNDEGMFITRKPGDHIKLKRSDARDVRTYQEAKALAQKEGVALEIVAD